MTAVAIIRHVGAVVLVAAAATVWFTMEPEAPATLDHSVEAAAIEVEDDANNELTDGAPQQTVVNGWTTNAYLALISSQMDAASRPAPRDDRPAAMLGLCVVGIAFLIATTRTRPISSRL